MISDDQVMIGTPPAETVSDRPTSVFLPTTAPRIHSPLNDLPSRGFELIDFADQIIDGGFMPWQKWLAEHSLKVKPDGRYFHPVTVASVARQNGKSTYMMARIMMGLFHWDESLQVSQLTDWSHRWSNFGPLCRSLRKMQIWPIRSSGFAGNMEPRKFKPSKEMPIHYQGRRIGSSWIVKTGNHPHG
jgi:hypothetical protein